ncbi:hypothetical protein Aperf_G00000091883 [Anoplocephala perfoliata]
MSLFDDLPEPVAESKTSKRALEDDAKGVETPAVKKPFLDLIGLLVGEAAEKGERAEMQDEHLNILDFIDQIANGSYSDKESVYSAYLMVMVEQRQLSNLAQIEKDIKRIILDVYKKTDEEFLKVAAGSRPHLKDGSTATTVLLVNNTLYIANIGDSAVSFLVIIVITLMEVDDTELIRREAQIAGHSRTKMARGWSEDRFNFVIEIKDAPIVFHLVEGG